MEHDGTRTVTLWQHLGKNLSYFAVILLHLDQGVILNCLASAQAVGSGLRLTEFVGSILGLETFWVWSSGETRDSFRLLQIPSDYLTFCNSNLITIYYSVVSPTFCTSPSAGEISLSRSITHCHFTRATETRGLGDVQDVQWTPALEAWDTLCWDAHYGHLVFPKS